MNLVTGFLFSADPDDSYHPNLDRQAFQKGFCKGISSQLLTSNCNVSKELYCHKELDYDELDYNRRE